MVWLTTDRRSAQPTQAPKFQENTMKNLTILAVLFAASAVACGGQKDATDEKSAASPASTTGVSSAAIRLERASRQVETGENVAEARAELALLLNAPELSAADKDDAALLLSRAYELLGDKENAIVTVENLLASHPGNQGNFAKAEDADKRLRKLLTGETASSLSQDDAHHEVMAPVAQALTKYFPKASSGTFEVSIHAVGRNSRESERLGTFAIDEAIRQSAERACPLCDKPKVHTHRSGYGSWTAIPGAREGFEKGLAIFYYDQQDARIPARYDALLPMPTAEIEKRLASGDGFIAVKERPNAPPVILFAAPRWGQLVTVEEAFAKLTALPTEPLPVKISASLSPKEIQSVVRAGFGKMKRCYEELTKREPKAQGKFVMAFKITSEGKIDDVHADDATTLKDAAFGTCMVDQAKTLVFPASRAKGDTTVKYPIEFSP
jgi:hypothetical protein